MAVSTSLTIKTLLSYHTVNNCHTHKRQFYFSVDGMNIHVICANHCCTFTSEELHFTYCKLEIVTILVHQHFHCVEVDIDADILPT